MSQYVQDVNMNLPAVPAMPTVNDPTAAKPEVQDPLLKSDPWKAFVGTPVKSQRGHDVHSGMTPQLQREPQKLTDVLAGTESSMTPNPAPQMPQNDDTASVLQALLAGQCSLLQGMNDLRANVVTRQQLQAFHDLQATEMCAYAQAELSPIHNTVRQHSANAGSMVERIARVESRIDAGGVIAKARPEIHDPARRRIAFIGFGPQTSAQDRICAM